MGKNFKIDARLILQLGRESIKDHTTALIELIKNSYDADASVVEVDIFKKDDPAYIRIADNGFGMTEKEVEDNWLTIGYSEKKKKKRSQIGRRKTGEKGIGRIAADRLGSVIQLLTKSENDTTQALEVNWDDFDVDDKKITDIDLKEIQDAKITIPKGSKTGTELIIKGLRHNWDEDDIYSLYQELTFFTPYNRDKKGFSIILNNDIDPNFSKAVKSAIYDVAEIDLELHYDGNKTLVYEFKNKINEKKNKTEIFDLNNFIQRTGREISELNCGPLELKLSFFPRTSSLVKGTGFSLKDLRDFLDDNAGIKIYRDNIAVKPYGFQNSQMGQDWVGLDIRKAKDPAGVRRKTYKVSSNQIVGSLFIGRDENSALKDSAAREGLVENDAFSDLKELVIGSVTLLESYRVDLVKEKEDKKKKQSKKSSATSSVVNITAKLNKVKNDLSEIKKYLDSHKDYKGSPVINSINEIEEVKEEAEETIEDLLDEKRVLGALATLGISSAVFGHETEGAINTFRSSTKIARNSLKKKSPDLDKAIRYLERAREQAKLISGWGAFALARIERDKRTKKLIKVKQVVEKVLNQVHPALKALNIEVEQDITDLYIKTYVMDIESIILNLITNSFNAVPNSKRPRKIKVLIYKQINEESIDGLTIEVGDSGPGIAGEYVDKIWNPLFTTKVGKKGRESGTGLGLTIVKSIVDELNGSVSVEKDPKLKGALFKIWIPTNEEHSISK
ncbi:sensor histidine kinase [Gracilimonas sp.]|uniref:sensor histidine kinase n=1 Tax=Gracilimonas sp. TaxID=1974203 RepID=UPI003BAAA23F